MQHSRIEYVVINSLGNCLVAIIVNQAKTDRANRGTSVEYRLYWKSVLDLWNSFTPSSLDEPPTSIKFFDWIVSEASRH